jgi:ligand-binding sensor domain-containing protein
MKYRIPLFDGVDLLILVVALGAVAFAGVVLTVRDVEDYLAGRAGVVSERDFVATERTELTFAVGYASEGARIVPDSSGLFPATVLLSTRDTRDLLLYEGLFYMATEGGLLEYRPSGTLLRHFNHLNGLPVNRTLCLAEWRGGLYVGCEGGLVRLEEEGSVVFVPMIPDGQAVTALLPLDNSRLLVGTGGAGLLSFDGSRFKRDIGRLNGAEFTKITALAVWGGQVAVGTRGEGLFVQRGAGFLRLGEEEGLPSAHVTALAPGPEDERDLLVATTGGLCLVDDRLSVTPWARPMPVSAALRTAGSSIVGTLDGRIDTFSAGRRRSSMFLGNRRFPVVIHRLVYADGRTWALTSDGIYRISGERIEAFGEERPFELQANHVAALALDASGNLWVGYFDYGIEVLSHDLQRVRLLDDDQCRTVKCLYFDPQENAVYAGTSKGMLRLHPGGGRRVWTKAEGLISNEVNHIRRYGREIVAGTGAGLSFVRGESVRSIYAFHGLINNKVFSLLPLGDRLFVGTLGGISILEGHQVVGQITPENSPLPAHWVTSLCDLKGSLLVGTYGRGLALRRADGSWESLPALTKDLEVNPNAVLLDDDFLLVGTLDRGVLMYHVNEGRWRVFNHGLSSPNVTAVAADEERLFIGTDNGVVVFNKSNL